LKIASIIGARPQFIKSASVSEAIKKIKSIDEFILHTGQHYDDSMSKIFFQEMDILKPKYNLNVNRIEYPRMINQMIRQIKPILLSEEVNGVLVYGDTNSTLAGSLAAKDLDIPVFHV